MLQIFSSNVGGIFHSSRAKGRNQQVRFGLASGGLAPRLGVEISGVFYFSFGSPFSITFLPICLFGVSNIFSIRLR